MKARPDFPKRTRGLKGDASQETIHHIRHWNPTILWGEEKLQASSLTRSGQNGSACCSHVMLTAAGFSCQEKAEPHCHLQPVNVRHPASIAVCGYKDTATPLLCMLVVLDFLHAFLIFWQQNCVQQHAAHCWEGFLELTSYTTICAIRFQWVWTEFRAKRANRVKFSSQGEVRLMKMTMGTFLIIAFSCPINKMKAASWF